MVALSSEKQAGWPLLTVRTEGETYLAFDTSGPTVVPPPVKGLLGDSWPYEGGGQGSPCSEGEQLLQLTKSLQSTNAATHYVIRM